MAASATMGVFLGNTSGRVSFPKTLSSVKGINNKAVSELGFVDSHLSGLKISDDLSFNPLTPISTKFSPAL